MNYILALAIGMSAMQIDGDVFMGNQLPQWGKVCVETGVYGEPSKAHFAIYTLPVDSIVGLHELSHDDGSWVMIKPARWIPLSMICWKDNNIGE